MNNCAMDNSFIKIIVDPFSHATRFLRGFESIPQQAQVHGKFALVLGGTEISDVPGISAAGISPADCRYTPASDAEALLLGKSLCKESIPTSPTGVVSPVVITRPMLKELGCEIDVIDCGVFVSPNVPHLRIGNKPARCIANGNAMDISYVKQLFEAGITYGIANSKQLDYLLLAECVPGGTTTAEAVLFALGHNVEGLISTSFPVPDRKCRSQLIQQGITAFGNSTAIYRDSTLGILSALGDPMQPFVLGAALAASYHTRVILCGGCQMMAIWALILKIVQEPATTVADYNFDNLVIITTKWVAFDRNAGSVKLAQILQAPLVAAMPDFSSSRHTILRAYERGSVKEGVGAGAGMATAHIIAGVQPNEIMHLIDDCYESLACPLSSTMVI